MANKNTTASLDKFKQSYSTGYVYHMEPGYNRGTQVFENTWRVVNKGTVLREKMGSESIFGNPLIHAEHRKVIH